MSSSSPAAPHERAPSKSSTSPITVSEARRLVILTLRFAVSPKDYALLRRRIISKGPVSVSSRTPTVSEFEAIANSPDYDDYLPAASRAGLRTFLISNILLNAWDTLTSRLGRRKTTQPLLRSFLLNYNNFLCSLSISTLIVLHRLLFRFFSTLRTNLLLPQAQAFRTKNPKCAKVLVSPLAPSIGPSLAGLALLIHPATEQRSTMSVYAFVKALEYGYNRLEDKGWFQNRPWWFGSWLLFPLTSGQLLYAFVFERDCFPTEYGNFIMKYSQGYVQARPENYPPHLAWPGTYDVIDSIANIAELKYPPFNSPILFPNAKTLPSTLASIAPVIEPAHPTIKSLQCALLHPSEPSCLKTYLEFWASEIPKVARFLAIIYTAAWIPRYRSFFNNPGGALLKIARATTLTSVFITGSIGTAWASNCLFQKTLPRSFLPKGRFWLAGMLGGMWAFVDKRGGRGNFLYSARIGLVSVWKTLVKKRLVKPVKNGDVLLFVLSLAAINALFDIDAHAVSGGAARRVLNSLRGKGLKDPITEEKQEKESETKRD